MSFRPLSIRGEEAPEFDGPHEGVPAWLTEPLVHWVRDWFFVTYAGYSGRYFAINRVRRLQVALRLRPALNLSGENAALRAVRNRMDVDAEFALNAVDYILSQCTAEKAADLEHYLREGGSAWQVTWNEADGSGSLTRRSLGPIREMIASVQPASDRAHQHLMDAWGKSAGRNPDPSGAYGDAVRAVEAVAKPVVLPKDNRATLGKMRTHIRDTLAKWEFTLGDPGVVYAMVDALWTEQLDRHGTDDKTAPLKVSPEQADAAVQMAITLVQLFAGGHFRRKP